MERRNFVGSLGLGALGWGPGTSSADSAGAIASRDPQAAPPGGAADRAYWVATATRVARPVLKSLAQGELRSRLPVQVGREDRQKFAALEAFGRTLTGLAPWLELAADDSPEGHERALMVALVRQGLARAVDPQSADFMNFTDGSQPLVDAAFLALALLRAPSSLLSPLEAPVRANLVKALRDTRRIKPGYNNWLLFSAMVETLFLEMGEEWDAMRVDLALRTCAEWYVGDSFFKDGPEYHHDYYNSFVIQPFMWTILQVLRAKGVAGYERLHALLERTTVRYAEVLERGISPEGTFPLYGRSIVYRFGAFQLLAQVALERRLAVPLTPPSVRSALTAVMRRSIGAPGTFDEGGWLRPGLAGHQPSLAERYICRGSLYLCCAVFLPLGLPPTDPFWAGAAEDWTGKRAWSGKDMPADHAMAAPSPA
jgi:hypothetical protein